MHTQHALVVKCGVEIYLTRGLHWLSTIWQVRVRVGGGGASKPKKSTEPSAAAAAAAPAPAPARGAALGSGQKTDAVLRARLQEAERKLDESEGARQEEARKCAEAERELAELLKDKEKMDARGASTAAEGRVWEQEVVHAAVLQALLDRADDDALHKIFEAGAGGTSEDGLPRRLSKDAQASAGGSARAPRRAGRGRGGGADGPRQPQRQRRDRL